MAITYNGWTFPEHHTTRVNISPVYDTSRRTVKYHHYTVNVSCYLTSDSFDGTGGVPSIASGNQLDPAVGILKHKITKPGKVLKIEDEGLDSNFTIGPTNVVGFGPQITQFVWRPVGYNKASHLMWTVEFDIIECENSSRPGSKVSDVGEFNYSVAYNIDGEGMTSRTIQGTLEAFVQRTGTTRLTDTADSYRERFFFPLPENFMREDQSYTLSEDRRTLIFSINDREIPSQNAFPRGMSFATGTYRVSRETRLSKNSLATSQGIVRVEINVTFNYQPGQTGAVAWSAFAALLDSRLRPLSRASRTFVVEGLDIEEGLWSRQMSFSASILVTLTLNQMIRNSGLWNRLPFLWKTWAEARPHLIDQRGYADLKYRPQLLADNCPPPAEQSWLSYDYNLKVYRDSNVAVTPPLEGGESYVPSRPVLGAGTTVEMEELTTPVNSVVVQDRAPETLHFTLSFSAKRVGYEIVPPKVVNSNSKEEQPTLIREDIDACHKVDETATGCPIYAIEGQRHYRIDRARDTKISLHLYSPDRSDKPPLNDPAFG